MTSAIFFTAMIIKEYMRDRIIPFSYKEGGYGTIILLLTLGILGFIAQYFMYFTS